MFTIVNTQESVQDGRGVAGMLRDTEEELTRENNRWKRLLLESLQLHKASLLKLFGTKSLDDDLNLKFEVGS